MQRLTTLDTVPEVLLSLIISFGIVTDHANLKSVSKYLNESIVLILLCVFA